MTQFPPVDLSFVLSVHQAHFLHTREGGPPQRAPAHVLGAGGGAERAPGAGRVRRLQPEHGPVLVLGAVRGGAVRGHDRQVARRRLRNCCFIASRHKAVKKPTTC